MGVQVRLGSAQSGQACLKLSWPALCHVVCTWGGGVNLSSPHLVDWSRKIRILGSS